MEAMMCRMSESPRMAWVKAHAGELMELAASFGAMHVCLCGSVARGEDSDGSDIDFYVREFDEGAPGTLQRIHARRMAWKLVEAFGDLSPYKVDVLGIGGGWLLDPSREATMRRDSIELSSLLD
jgi:predicted nucleotidyltransferase